MITFQIGLTCMMRVPLKMNPNKLGQVLVDAHRDSETLKESKEFEKMLEDYRKILYPDCKQELKKLGTTLEMLQWKAANGVSDKGFEELLGLVKNMLPEGNELSLQRTNEKRVFALLGWTYRRFTHVLTIVSSITVNMRNWMHVLSVTQSGIRSGKMVLVMSMVSPQGKIYRLR